MKIFEWNFHVDFLACAGSSRKSRQSSGGRQTANQQTASKSAEKEKVNGEAPGEQETGHAGTDDTFLWMGDDHDEELVYVLTYHLFISLSIVDMFFQSVLLCV